MGFPLPSDFITITPWASTATYPVGSDPWQVTATKVAPGYSYFTPGVAPGAQELNYILNRDISQTNTALGNVYTSMESLSTLGQYWPFSRIGETVSATDMVVRDCVWNSYLGRWLYWVDQVDSSAHSLTFQSVSGQTFYGSTTTTTLTSISGIGVNPTNGHMVLYEGNQLKFYLSTDGDTWTQGSGTPVAPFNSTGSGTHIPDYTVPLSSFIIYSPQGGGRFYLFQTFFNNGTSNYFIEVCRQDATALSSSSTWTNITTLFPGTFTTNDANIPEIRAVSTPDGIFVCGFAADGSFQQLTVAVDFLSGLDVVVNNTLNTLPFALIEAFCGPCWAAEEGVISLVVTETSSPHTSKVISMNPANLFTSTSVPWTVDYTFHTLSVVGGDLACCGNLYTLAASVAGGSNHAELYISAGRSSWALAGNFEDAVNGLGDSDNVLPTRIVCNGNQLMVVMERHVLLCQPQGVPALACPKAL